jgi:hypothetical protein
MDNIKSEFPLREAFLEEFKKYTTSDFPQIYRHIFSCMESESLERLLENLKEEVKTEDWFYSFHKSMRQTDFFDDINVHYTVNIQAEQDLERLEVLRKILPFHDSKGKIWVDAVDSDEAKQLGLEREAKEFRFLKGKAKTERKRNISGHMDMILWNLIHADKTNFLKVFIERFFKLQEIKNLA